MINILFLQLKGRNNEKKNDNSLVWTLLDKSVELIIFYNISTCCKETGVRIWSEELGESTDINIAYLLTLVSNGWSQLWCSFHWTSSIMSPSLHAPQMKSLHHKHARNMCARWTMKHSGSAIWRTRSLPRLPLTMGSSCCAPISGSPLSSSPSAILALLLASFSWDTWLTTSAEKR